MKPKLSRREFMRTCAAGASAFLSSRLFAEQSSANKGKRPNVVLFVSDDHGLDALGCYGNPAIKTPNMDQLAAEGVRFTHAFCTSASCSASRSVILTGLYNHATGQYGLQHGYNNFHTFTDVKSLPVLLAKAGYRTASIGKFHVQPESVYHFQTYLRGNKGGWRNPATMAALAGKWIKETDNKPFFLYFCTVDPHRSGGKADELPYSPDRFGNRPEGDCATVST
jgi:N-sulfoglucosamine sulfohydrolase